mgnify:CR=1 FL=1
MVWKAGKIYSVPGPRDAGDQDQPGIAAHQNRSFRWIRPILDYRLVRKLRANQDWTAQSRRAPQNSDHYQSIQ